MAKAEGRIFDFQDKTAIDSKLLETINFSDNKQLINIETDEFSAVCPFSGLPDYADLTIKYVPDKLIVELKSLKYYFITFRNVGIYQEEATERIFNDLDKLLEPIYLKLILKYNKRGGIIVTTEKEKGKLEF
ncbi:NADPH-dependent 7-cyano-7-deazaguanine reductase QueF [candidate division WOR-3 bacterium]|nr:NADPH-dependent 7-cyano-7-deazaguanine reductase QueF [candidate division WOR-3 bacterium]